MKYKILAVVALVFAPVLLAQTADLKIEGDTTIVVKSLPFKVTVPLQKKAVYIWNHSSNVKSVENRNVLTITSAPKGEVTIKVKIITYDKVADDLIETNGQITFSVGSIPPTPGPDPPAPPGPTPDPPGPTPDPAPIPLAGFRCLIIYESAELSKLPPAQQSVIYGKTVRDALHTACVDDGTTKGWWMLDKDVDVTGLAKHWQDAMKRPRKSVPWIILSNGKTGYEGPLPATVDEMLTMIKKYSVPTKKGGK